VIRRAPLTLLQLKCFLSCKSWEKLKLTLPFLVRGREREGKGKEEEKRENNIRKGWCYNFVPPENMNCCFVPLIWYIIRLIVDDSLFIVFWGCKFVLLVL